MNLFQNGSSRGPGHTFRFLGPDTTDSPPDTANQVMSTGSVFVSQARTQKPRGAGLKGKRPG